MVVVEEGAGSAFDALVAEVEAGVRQETGGELAEVVLPIQIRSECALKYNSKKVSK